jgi:hypothetical protein
MGPDRDSIAPSEITGGIRDRHFAYVAPPVNELGFEAVAVSTSQGNDKRMAHPDSVLLLPGVAHAPALEVGIV